MEIIIQDRYYTKQIQSKDLRRVFDNLYVDGKRLLLMNNNKTEAFIVECYKCEAENSKQIHLKRDSISDSYSSVTYDRADIINTINLFWNDGD